MVQETAKKHPGKRKQPDYLRRQIREMWRFTDARLTDVAERFSAGRPKPYHPSAIARIAESYERDHGLSPLEKEDGPGSSNHEAA